MTHQEAGRKGGLATLTKYGSAHFQNAGKLGGRPPLASISQPTAQKNHVDKGGHLGALKQRWAELNKGVRL